VLKHELYIYEQFFAIYFFVIVIKRNMDVELHGSVCF